MNTREILELTEQARALNSKCAACVDEIQLALSSADSLNPAPIALGLSRELAAHRVRLETVLEKLTLAYRS